MVRRPDVADFDVLIVGGGPTGLMAGCELLRRGVRVRIIDRAIEPLDAPKALSLWPRAHDILADLGVLDGLRRASVRIDAFSYFSGGRPLATFGFPADLASRTLPQPETERLLTERLATLGGKVERGVRLLCLEDLDFTDRIDATDGVTAVLEYGDGAVERVRVPFLIGADGASSAVRGQLGIGFAGTTYEMAFALVDARIDGRLPANEIRYYQNRSGTLVIVPQPAGVFRFLSVMREGQEVSVPMMQAVIDQRGPAGVRIAEPVWQTVFRVHARYATDFQRGRVFLMGDAAHVHSPAGGQGMNNGLQDAQNLGWKLAAVIHGESPAALLASFGPERSAATRRIVRDTDLQTRAWMFNGPAQVWLRDAVFRLLEHTGAVSRFYAPVMAGRRLAYPPTRPTQRPSGWSVCQALDRFSGAGRVGAVFPRRLALAYRMAGPDADPSMWTVAVLPHAGADGWPAEVDRLVARWPRVRVVRMRRADAVPAIGCRRAGYHLVRPDGHIAAHGHRRDLERLATELTTAFADRELDT